MREILFKAQQKDSKKWVQGFYASRSETTYAFCQDYQRYPVKKHHYILQDEMTDWGLPNRHTAYEIEPETLCQYTGLTDKNGVKIFEGDIVHYQYEPGKGFWNVDQNCIVSFRGAGFHIKGIMGTNKYACMSGWISQLPIESGKAFEVIGNIHDKEATHEE